MAGTTIICTDGSELANQAALAGVSVLEPADRTIVVTVIESADLAIGAQVSGFAGSAVTAEEFDRGRRALAEDGRAAVERTVAALGVPGATTEVLEGDPGAALCSFAQDVGATAIVMGSRGRGGFKRALLGSVSDFVVRNAPCPVVITNASESE
jgi:nucleotide-binding universal stress UspA family protein